MGMSTRKSSKKKLWKNNRNNIMGKKKRRKKKIDNMSMEMKTIILFKSHLETTGKVTISSF